MCRKISLQGSWHGKPVPPTFLLYLFFLMPGHILEMDKVKKMETNCVGRVVAAVYLTFNTLLCTFISAKNSLQKMNDLIH